MYSTRMIDIFVFRMMSCRFHLFSRKHHTGLQSAVMKLDASGSHRRIGLFIYIATRPSHVARALHRGVWLVQCTGGEPACFGSHILRPASCFAAALRIGPFPSRGHLSDG